METLMNSSNGSKTLVQPSEKGNDSLFSFIILTYNEEIHLPRLLKSIAGLNAPIFVLDSGSTDNTIAIAKAFGATIAVNPFVNHPRQWDYALKTFKVDTPWTIGLDADQIVSKELFEKLDTFNQKSVVDEVNAIYFNRKNYFKGRWIKHGGYFPKYLLKMFRTGVGYSDLNENMDHRFIVPGRSIIWRDGYLIEENMKENRISFWIEKHNRYSEQIAQEEIERRKNLRFQVLKPKMFGTPDEKIAYLKSYWWRMPLYLRPVLYFAYRYFFKLGILDGKQGLIFHFLQGFWFRLVVDIKIEEKKNDILRGDKHKVPHREIEIKKISRKTRENQPVGTI